MLPKMLRHGFYACLIAAITLIMVNPMTLIPITAALNTPTETGVYTEDFSTYINKDHANRSEWDIWSHKLNLGYSEDKEPVSKPKLAVDENGNSFIVWDHDGNIYAQKLDAKGNRLWAMDLRVNAHRGLSWEGNPAIDIDMSGNAVIVWKYFEDIYAQKLDTNGNRVWLADVRVSANSSTSAQEYPAITVDGSGNAVIVWCDHRNYGQPDIYAQKLSASGNRLWMTDVHINSDIGTPVDNPTPAIAEDPSGNAVIIWSDDRNGSSTSSIYAQRLSPDGNKLWTNDTRVSSYSGMGSQSESAITIADGGNTIVAWCDGRNNSTGIYAQKLDINGNHLWATDARVTTDSITAGQSNPVIAVYEGNKAVIAWEDNRNGTNSIYAQLLKSDGSRTWVGDMRVNADSGVTAKYTPTIDSDGNGAIFVAWKDSRNGRFNCYLQKVDGTGTRMYGIDAPVNANRGTTNQYKPAIATEGDGNVIVVWYDYRNINPDIYAQKYNASGNKLWVVDVRVTTDSVTVAQDDPAIVLDGSGNAVVVWNDYRNGGYGIYAQKLDTHGNRTWVTDVRVNSRAAVAGNPAVAMDVNGSTVVVWKDFNSPSNQDIYAQKLDANGHRLWINDVQVNTGGVMGYFDLQKVAVSESGFNIVVWEDHRNSDPDIYAQELDPNGSRVWGTDLRVNSDDGTAWQEDPDVGISSDGRAIVAWDDNRNGHYDIYAQALNSSGGHLWTTDVPVNSDTGTTSHDYPTVAVDATGNALVAWNDTRSGVFSSDIYAQLLNASGTRLWVSDVRVNSDDSTTSQIDPDVAADKIGNFVVVWQDDRNEDADSYAQKINSVGDKGWLADLQVVDPDVFYLPSGLAQSRTVDTIAGDIRQATLTANYQLNGGDLEFALSNNAGVNWITSTLGTATVFTTTGSDLRWRAVLTGDPIWRNRSPIVTSLRIEYSTALPYADAYEPDDACSQAKPIAVNGATQAHTFHQSADADWVWFDVISGTTYVIQTANPQLNADTTLELRLSCPQPPLGTDDNAFGRDARLTWRATFTGRVYAKAANHLANVYGADTGYDLSVRTYTQPPVVVIVGGHDDGYSLQSHIDYLSDLAYRTFLNSGVPKANIRYFSPNPNRDVDGNGLNDDIFATATITTARDAVQDWSRTRGVSLGVPFYLYLVDHGYYDQFLAAGSNERVLAEQLNLWLSNLEATSGADNINVILEACKSGSFIDVTTLGPNKISGRNRVVIASTSSTLDAYPSTQGAYFSDVFWTAVGQNQDLKTAFETAKQAVQATGLSQQPWLDDNGDAVADAQDGAVARGRGLGQSFGDRAPTIDGVQIGDIASGTGTIQAQIRDDFGVDKAWVVVYPPGFVAPPPSSDPTPPVVNVPTRTLTLTGSKLFSTSFNGFTQTGHYQLVVYAQDAEQHQAAPLATQVCVNCSFVYLPLVRK